MARYILRRILISIVLLVIATFICFGLVQLLGDPIANCAEGQRQRNPAGADVAIAAAYERAGLNVPFLERYWNWLVSFIQGDWGTTVNPGRTPVDVEPIIMRALGITVRLVLVATIVAIILGMLIGVVSAVRQYSFFDYTLTGFSFLMFSMPIFAIAVLLKIAGISFNDFLESMGGSRWLVTAGYPPQGFTGGFFHQLWQWIGVYILPTLSLLLISFAQFARYQRASMLEVLNADYVRTARAKGLPRRKVIWGHAYRNALIPVVTVAALSMGTLFSGAIITETVFGWQGMGRVLVQYVRLQEPYMILAWLVVTALFIILFNLIADIIYTVLDPRIRLD